MISGLQKMTLLDFPGRVACTVFLQGCNFRCPFCHNSELLPGKGEPLMAAHRDHFVLKISKNKYLMYVVGVHEKKRCGFCFFIAEFIKMEI